MTEQDNQDLAGLAPERLAEMVREKRKDEQTMRQRLRDAEARADRAEQAVSSWQTQLFEAQAKDAGVAPTALADVTTHVQLADLLGEDGVLDAAKAQQALSDLRAERPHLFVAHQGNGDGQFHGDGQEDHGRDATWADVLQ